jgi:hypothetical protein
MFGNVKVQILNDQTVTVIGLLNVVKANIWPKAGY